MMSTVLTGIFALKCIGKAGQGRKSKDVTMKNKVMLLRSFVMANLLLDEQRITALQMKSYRKLLGVSWKQKKTNEWVRDKIKKCCGRELEEVVDVVKRGKFR